MFHPTNAAASGSTSDVDYPVEFIDLDRMNALAGKIETADDSERSSFPVVPSQEFVSTNQSSPQLILPSGIQIVHAPRPQAYAARGHARVAGRGRPLRSSMPGRVLELHSDPKIAEENMRQLQNEFPYLSPMTVHRVYMNSLQKLDRAQRELARINELEMRKRNVQIVPENKNATPLLKPDADTSGMAKRVLLLDPKQTRNVKPTTAEGRAVKDEDVSDTEARIREFMSKSCVCIVPASSETSVVRDNGGSNSVTFARGRGRPRGGQQRQSFNIPKIVPVVSDGDNKKVNLLNIARRPLTTKSEEGEESISSENEERERVHEVDVDFSDSMDIKEDEDEGFQSVNNTSTQNIADTSTQGGKKFFKHKRRVTNDTPPSTPPQNVSSSPAIIGKTRSAILCTPPTPSSITSENTTPFEYFNNAPEEELCLIPTCSLRKANLIVSLRPFTSEDDFIARVGNGLSSLSSSTTTTGSPPKGSNATLGSSFTQAQSLWQGAQELIHLRSTVQKLLRRCDQHVGKHNSDEYLTTLAQLTSEVELTPELRESLKRLGSSGIGTTIPEGDGNAILEQPKILNPNLRLKPFQLVGLNWLHQLHSRNLNGILADDMGLGKTIQSIAFLAYLLESRNDRGPHLVIVPTTTLGNWAQEFQRWCPALKVILYSGSQEERKHLRLRIYDGTLSDFNVLLTSYHIATSSIEDRSLMKRISFHCGIFDEAHMLKNMLSQRYRNFMNFTVQKRLLLTGTPLQNSITELFSLLAFLMPDLFGQYVDTLKKLFNHYTRASQELNMNKNERQPIGLFENEKIQHARTMLKPFLLRRMKSQVLSQLPPKKVQVIQLQLSGKQQVAYESELERLKVSMQQQDIGSEEENPDFSNKRSRNGAMEGSNNGTTDMKKLNSVPRLMQLRKAANHPLMLQRFFYSSQTLRKIANMLVRRDPGHEQADERLVEEDLLALSSDIKVHAVCRKHQDVLKEFLVPDEVFLDSAKFAFLDDLLPKLSAAKERVLIFSQFVTMLDILEEYLRIRGHTFLRLDGSTPGPERQQLIDRFNPQVMEESDAELPFVFLLSTRAGGLGINLSGANVVIIHDIDFNPQMDKQAEDRAHRVGQTKEVRVYRLIVNDTIEQAMFDVAEEKLKLGEVVTSSDLQQQPQQSPQQVAGEEEEDTNEADEELPVTTRKRPLTNSTRAGLQDSALPDEEDEMIPGLASPAMHVQEVLKKILSSK